MESKLPQTANTNLKFFEETPAKMWDFDSFKAYHTQDKRNPQKEASIRNKYRKCLKEMSEDPFLEGWVKAYVDCLTALDESTRETSDESKAVVQNTFAINGGTAVVSGNTVNVTNENLPHKRWSPNVNMRSHKKFRSMVDEPETKQDQNDDSSDDTFELESSTSSNISEVAEACPHRLYYLVGAGLESYKLPSNAVKWIVDKVDITGEFLGYRDKVVRASQQLKEISVYDQLALNFIFFISDTAPIGHFIQPSTWDTVIKAVKTECSLKSIAEDDAHWCVKLNSAARKGNGYAKAVLRQWRVAQQEEPSILYQDIYDQLLKAYSDPFFVECLNEDTFVQQALLPILKTFFPNSRLIYAEGANGVIRASRERKQAFEPDSEGKKADFSIHTLDGDKSQLLLLVECKAPRSTSSDDFAKVANCLKDCIDKATRAGADNENIEVCGLICNGVRCRAYAMDLKFHGVYRMKEVGTFYVPHDRHNLDVLMSAFEVMSLLQIFVTLKDIVLNSAKLCKESIRIPETSKRSTMVLPSFESPIRLADQQIRSVLQNVPKSDVYRASRKLEFVKE
ncbi:hypothetical protein EC973_009459 [Apophysomyces ossiformis]|uniref:Uncharacterized protein n=1 Tax=Apophysomyces ossiformis TaxID=679940 RepID=A0A8H7ENF1_9FUNG|nr:hypothetical protein EC973_009459 [Apophysomyces ossiformis]